MEERKPMQTIRTGYAHMSNSATQIGRNTSEMAVKQHMKHQVVGQYFQAKVTALEQKEAASREEDDANWLVSKVVLALSQAREQENELMA